MRDEMLDEWCIPKDHSRQVISSNLAKNILLQNENIKTVMDLGCGTGRTVSFFREINPDVRWIGLDIETSSEVNVKRRSDAEFVLYDGVNIPFEDNYFDMIYSNQVFEHVRYPAELLKEVHRVLKPNGYFVGSTSQLEPYHAYSVWNFTPYGFRLLIEEAGLQLVEIRPSIDALTMIIRRGLGSPKFFSRWWSKESPLNKIISLAGWLTKKKHQKINYIKLLFCGQFCFIVKNPK